MHESFVIRTKKGVRLPACISAQEETCEGFAAKKVRFIRELQVPETQAKPSLQGLAPRVSREHRLLRESKGVGSWVLLIEGLEGGEVTDPCVRFWNQTWGHPFWPRGQGSCYSAKIFSLKCNHSHDYRPQARLILCPKASR